MRTTMCVVAFCAAAAAPAAGGPRGADRKKPVPLYTNEDLERYATGREEPAPAASPAEATSRQPERPPQRGEDYWRREADRVRERISVLGAEADALRARLAARAAAARASARTASGRKGLETSPAEWESRLRSLEERIRKIQSDLEERARRAGALPGWLR